MSPPRVPYIPLLVSVKYYYYSSSTFKLPCGAIRLVGWLVSSGSSTRIVPVSRCLFPTMASYTDPHTFANFNQIQQRHIHFDWTVDFDRQVLDGSVTIEAEALEDGVSEFICDNR